MDFNELITLEKYIFERKKEIQIPEERTAPKRQLPDKDGFEKPSKINRLYPTIPDQRTIGITVSNPYDILQIDEDEDNKEDEDYEENEENEENEDNEDDDAIIENLIKMREQEKKEETKKNHEKIRNLNGFNGKQNNSTPIILRNKEKWTKVSKELNDRKISITRATNTNYGIKIQPTTIDDYRTLYKYLKENNYEFHTHQLSEERNLRIVIKGVPLEIKDDEIKEDLKEKGYPTIKITRMMGKNNKPIQMILIEIEKKYKSIYNIKSINGLDILIEPLKSKQIVQCYRCQLFGHVQKNCTADYKCMKCAADHPTYQCTKEKTTPARCSNCNGEHTSIDKKCPKRPTLHQKSAWRELPKPEIKDLKTIQFETKKQKTSQHSAQKNPKTEIAQQLTNLLLQFNETKPTANQISTFSKTIQNILLLIN